MNDPETFTGILIMALIGQFQDQWRCLSSLERTLVIEDAKAMCAQHHLGVREATQRIARRTTSLDVYATALVVRHQSVGP